MDSRPALGAVVFALALMGGAPPWPPTDSQPNLLPSVPVRGCVEAGGTLTFHPHGPECAGGGYDRHPIALP
ncbi:hypothetical protein C1701_09815 [Actinoalloteichus sp. AHMU CJ021]|uniref:Secreted protein n=1 Tax=Actinoalloteichus caeruleus DSM 43889 TaxID=1120930 RepID=A0ABT1JK78_ACTCY|nr:hypothetical protein [Actinoalloteichus caeruleus]AUS78617.1 hypothetical protein C1701_09815 [Actinoalloteichus sp. AHMU CJ021]MCP2332747.1 hypothetical protein [Actinoalloteichus caeruleus DSM 43889]